MEPRVGIINVTGYAGMELARLLSRHPRVRLTSVTGRGLVGQTLAQALPHLFALDLPITQEPGEVDFLFSALPHKASAEALLPYIRRGIKVVDISADFRLKDAGEYERWYETKHPAPELLPEAVYGLPELHRGEIKKARVVANPGCYPTAAILALAPALKEGLISTTIIIDAKSGVSGAGRALSLNIHFAEANEDVSAYALEGHRHLAEMTQELNPLSPEPLRITFVPHLVPMTRGILATCYASLIPGKLPADEKGEKDLLELYRRFYRGEPFVRVVDSFPHTKHTLGSNLCLIHPTLDPRTGRLIVLSAIDNLVKGAAGQAVQNMNLMLGLPETLGLEAPALFP